MMKDIFYMKKAIKLAKLGEFTTSPNPNVGCIIVKNNIIIGKGWHRKQGEKHAEIHALSMAKGKTKGATAYVTLEPCSHFGLTPPCCLALIQAGIIRVVIAVSDPNPKVSGKGIIELKKAGILIKIGIMSKESQNLNQGFFKRMKTGIPWIQLKLGISIDGRSALKNGKSKWITSPESRKDVQYFRKKSGVILSTSQTILIDNPLLNVRKDTNILSVSNEAKNQPIRVIIDSKNRIQPFHKCVNSKGEIWLARLKQDKNIWPNNVKQVIFSQRNNQINLKHLISYLGNCNINNIWIEAGASLSGSLIKLNIIDELILYVAPKLLGHHAKPLCMLEKYLDLNKVPTFTFKDVTKIGTDIRFILKIHKNKI
ncbi:bifunctional diaminohydroxyphosphoribosylaminopyrimidine deaminase/5-amino-6-(5-phosphoribosylamino)uracil reductase RibD [Buchnera aphidicola (Pemphigus obesinymphae)]|uniref:bifunctional diaminohydroxyphosphoribosylaminopyrimidine deaminase/5-amino-6-(5-phosphoribosylamino)uracil reductase RibD n=1 Tax=Buchnera aphidicola TaxID=9 RepID=UPI002238360C|nr:bifunctional diaminohydroxyphosphoribosylaminopyrimidine deaminase/5-amino-6-(5-phosphoribosylamino)uracil reductase RibD [Buchnera aphidicola]MCW5196368.1 bifunctional diaminohydroxyphosphoribosylaminopyrimidine deaminase/5-amino-6-(5-phosphoribosylamino)uracil reductase RibD [Buchnera aphidicola (Pemphigus obesinymphae)]